MISVRRGFVWCLAVCLSLLVVSPPAQAHVEAVRDSDPAHQSVVTEVTDMVIEFADQIDAETAEFSLRSSDGSTHRLEPAAISDDRRTVTITASAGALADGLYRLGYQIVFPDGHPAVGVIQFEVSASGAPQAEPWPAEDPAPSRAEPERLDVSAQLPWIITAAVVVLAAFTGFIVLQRRRSR